MVQSIHAGISGLQVAVTADGITCLDEQGQLGCRGLRLTVAVNGIPQAVTYTRIDAAGDGLEAHGAVGDSLLTCRTTVSRLPGMDAIVFHHTLVNATGREATIGDLRMEQAAGGRILLGPGNRMHLRYCHTDNVRTERYPFCQEEYPYVRQLPTAPVKLGYGEDQPFPALYLTDRDYACGLVLGAAGQETIMQTWELAKGAAWEPSVFSTFAIHYELPQTDGLLLAPHSEFTLDGTYLQLLHQAHPQDAYVDYIDWLAGQHHFYGQTTPLLRQAFYCSWNYREFGAQYEDRMLTTARFIAGHMPNIKIFLVDAGFHMRRHDIPGLSSDFLSRYYPDPRADIDPEKFPHGMAHFSAEIRKLGMRPGIWWTPTVVLESQLYQDHPDWFLRDDTGSPYTISGTHGFLDFTLPEVIDFTDRVLSVVINEWDMDAVKMDFWSQNFEDRDGRVARAAQTALDGRRNLLGLVRKHLPADGVFMTCVATGMGNPFIGHFADTYRNTIDIGQGVWREQIDNCIWALPTLGFEGRKTLLLNQDSAGINLDCPENENFFRLTWCYIIMGMQEMGGDFEKLPELYVKALRKFTDRCDRGYRCLCPDERAFTGEPFPEVLYVDFPDDSPTRQAGVRQNLAFFNWTDEPKIVSIRRDRLGHQGPVRAVNFWTEEEETFADEFIVKRLEGRSALLYDILVM